MVQPPIDLHLGAHKTASTFLQNTLKHHRNHLRKHGIEYFGPNELRPNFKQIPFADFVTEHARSPSMNRIFMSDENFLGFTSDISRHNALYIDLPQKLSGLEAWIGQKPARIFISIRGYYSFYPSVVAQALSAPQERIFEAEKSRDNFLHATRRWPEIIREIRTAFPTSELIIWQYEDFHNQANALLQYMVGDAASGVKLDLTKNVHRSLTVEAHEFLRHGISLGINGINLRRFLRNNPIENGTYFRDIFWEFGDEDELDEQYAQDIATIKNHADDKTILMFQ